MRTQALSHQETGLFVEITATPAAFSTSHLLGRSQQHIPDIVQLDGQLTPCSTTLLKYSQNGIGTTFISVENTIVQAREQFLHLLKLDLQEWSTRMMEPTVSPT